MLINPLHLSHSLSLTPLTFLEGQKILKNLHTQIPRHTLPVSVYSNFSLAFRFKTFEMYQLSSCLILLL